MGVVVLTVYGRLYVNVGHFVCSDCGSEQTDVTLLAKLAFYANDDKACFNS